MAEKEQRGVPLPHLAAWRRYVALTQSELAERADVSRPTITRAERGEPVSLPNVRAIAEALGITVQKLYRAPEETDEATPGQSVRVA